MDLLLAHVQFLRSGFRFRFSKIKITWNSSLNLSLQHNNFFFEKQFNHLKKNYAEIVLYILFISLMRLSNK